MADNKYIDDTLAPMVQWYCGQATDTYKEDIMRVTFEMEKATKNTIRFAEVLESELAAPKIGSVYIPKSTLGELKWKEGMRITMEVEVE